MGKKVKRLVEQFVPENYKILVKIDEEAMSFSGDVKILGRKVGRPTKRLTFHQNSIDVTSAKIYKFEKGAKKEIKVDRINKQNKVQEVRLHAQEMIYPGEYLVEMTFGAKLNDNMNGLYPCYYQHEGQTKKVFATQFESHHARDVFPCIDEPAAKATFDLSLIASENKIFLSNTPEKSSKNLDGHLIKKTFETTPLMSSYLLAFVCGDFHYIEGSTRSGVLVRVWATIAQKKEDLKYALKEAIAIQDFFEDYFKTPFPLKKCDHVALPDFDAGAMENWGLITYREVGLLNDTKNPSVPSEQYTSLVIAHELSHQWFGNLVTMAWWDDLWLNESFASIMEHLPLLELHPEWQQWEKYATYDVISASNRDVFKDVQTVGVEVNHPDEIRSLFDGAIVYSKGGRLIKMMREYVSDETLRIALQKYFSNLAYKNATRDDLWQYISEASRKDINSLMTPWIEQSGMPIITVSPASNNKERKLSQSRFIFDKDDDQQIWPVPLLSHSETSPEILSKSSQIISLSKDEPLLLNENGSGHYVVKYEEKRDIDNLLESLKTRKINPEARINVLNDYLLMARRGDVKLTEILELITPMSEEPRDAVWDMILRTIGYSSAIGENNKIIESGLDKLRFNLASKNNELLGWEDKKSDDPNTRSLRATMLSLMAGSKDKKTIDFILSYYNKTKIDDIPADRRSLVFSVVVKHGKDTKEIDELINLYKDSQNPDMLSSLCAGLCSTEDAKLAQRLLTEGLGDKGFVKPQDYFRWYAYFSRNKHTRKVTWEWMTKEWERLLEMFSGGINIEAFITYSAGPIYDKEQAGNFRKFFEPKLNIVRVSRDIKIALNEINSRVEWKNRELEGLENYFIARQ